MPEPKIDEHLPEDNGLALRCSCGSWSMLYRNSFGVNAYDEHANHVAKADAEAALDHLRTENAGLREALEASEAECAKVIKERDAMRPVVDLVRLVIEHQRPGTPAGPSWESRRDQLWTSLATAVDSYTQSSNPGETS